MSTKEALGDRTRS